MNKYKYFTFMGLFVLLLNACSDPDLAPIVVFDDDLVGAYVRFVSQEGNAEFDLANPSASEFTYNVDFVSINEGDQVARYIVEAEFFDNSPDNGDQGEGKGRQVFVEVDESAFVTSSRGNPGTSVKVSFNDILTLFGLTADDLRAGDSFSLFGAVITKNGQEFRSTNSTATVRGSAFQGFFDINVNATCPLSSDIFVGEYELTFDGDAGTGYGLPFNEGTVVLETVAGSSTKRSFSVTYLPGIGGFGPYPVNFDILCDKAVFLDMTAGVGCGQGSLTIGPAFDETGARIDPSLDISDDSTLELVFNEGFNTSGCASVSETLTRAILTKK